MTTIKKDIEAILNKGEGLARINNISFLSYNTTNGIGEAVDNLILAFNYIGGVKGGARVEIKARTYEGIIAEIKTATENYFATCKNELIKNLKNGYRQEGGNMKNSNLLKDIMPEIDFIIRGKSYKEKKNSLAEIARNYQNEFSNHNLFYSEIAILNEYFERNGKKYGLLKEFRENAII